MLAEDPACAVIACAFEGVAHPLKMLAAAERAWDNDKPLVVFKLATGEFGAAAASSHTGSLAGSNASCGRCSNAAARSSSTISRI